MNDLLDMDNCNASCQAGARILFLPVYGRDAFEPLCSLLKMDDFLGMLECGWSSCFNHSTICKLDKISAQGLIDNLD